jgi:hypothetical protein
LVKRRTNPGFLTNAEAARDRERLSEMVRGIVGEKPSRPTVSRSYGRRQVERQPNWNSIRKVGESNNFVVEYNYDDKLIAIYGKEFYGGSLFRLRFSVSESKALGTFLARARNTVGNRQVSRIGETDRFFVDYDGNQQLAMVYEKEPKKLQVKLAFNENEITPVIDLLMKARAFF